MAEFDYFGSINDNKTLLKLILEKTELILFPVLNYKSEKELISARMYNEQIENLIEEKTMFHLWNSSFYPTFPLRFRTLQSKDEKLVGLIDFRASPSLVFSSSKFVINEDNCLLRCVSGTLYHTKELYDETNNAVIFVPQSLRDSHKVVVNLMKQKLIKFKNRSLWFGEEAYELFMKGEMEIYSWNYGGWITYKNLI